MSFQPPPAVPNMPNGYPPSNSAAGQPGQLPAHFMPPSKVAAAPASVGLNSQYGPPPTQQQQLQHQQQQHQPYAQQQHQPYAQQQQHPQQQQQQHYSQPPRTPFASAGPAPPLPVASSAATPQHYQQPQQPPHPPHALSNGVGNGSNLSSRTVSPAHSAKFGPPPTAASTAAVPIATNPSPYGQQQQSQPQYQQPPQQQSSQQQQQAAFNQQQRPPPPPTSVHQLTGSMQNVSLLANGPAPPPAVNGNGYNGHANRLPQPPPSGNYPQQQQQPQQPLPNNNHVGFPPIPPPTSSGPASQAPAGSGLPKRPAYPQQPPPPMQQHQQQQQQQQYAHQPHAAQHQQTHYQQQQQYGQPPPQTAFNGQPMSQAAAAPLQYQQHFNNFGEPAAHGQLGQQQQQPYGGSSSVQHGFNKLWGHEKVDLMQQRHVLPQTRVKPPPIELGNEFFESVNCSPDVLRCTINKIPESNNLLQKSRLPLGILIHPFRDLSNLPVVQCSVIVRCRSCRTYINPFVNFVDSKKWRCNLCYRVNELPDEFQYDPTTKSYGDVTRRPEVRSSTIEFIAPSEYMLRPPQPAIYLFLLDVSQIAVQSGYLEVLCASLSEHLDKLPGDVRTQVGFIAYNSALHFYSMGEGFNQPHEITIVDIEDPFVPCPDNLLVNLAQCRELIKDLLQQLPVRFANSYDSSSALGSALLIAQKMVAHAGGRVTVFQSCLPNAGPGALKPRENPNERSAKDVHNLGPATDYYKRLALDASGNQIAIDLFLVNSQYSDMATLSDMSKHSGGCMHHFPLFNKNKPQQVELFQRTLERYISRKIGFESVMRVRCTRGLTVHTFHGNFFVRSTDLLSLPNVNPDAGFGMQISYEESLTEAKTVCFQAALLYTSSKGTRRIRVHTLCVPVSNSLTDIIHSADQQAIIGLISKMAVDRSLSSSLGDARDAFINASVDVFSAFRMAMNLPGGAGTGLVAPRNLALLPMYMMALLKHMAFRTGTSTRLDDRVFAMCQLKTMPLDQLIRNIYPDFYVLDELFYRAAQGAGQSNGGVGGAEDGADEEQVFVPALLQLSAEKLDSRSVFLLDNGLNIFILVGSNVPEAVLEAVFGISHVNQIPDTCLSLPETGTAENEALHQFISSTYVEKPIASTIQIIRDSSPARSLFIEHLVDDRSESSLSYYEFLQHLRTQVK